MSTLTEIQKQIDELIKQKEELLSKEKGAIIAEIKKQIEAYGISAEELGLGSKQKNSKAKNPVKIKFKNLETGETWTGRGRKPKWCQKIISEKGFEFFEEKYSV